MSSFGFFTRSRFKLEKLGIGESSYGPQYQV